MRQSAVNIWALLLCAIPVVISVGCKGNAGPTGPQGPQGPQGTTDIRTYNFGSQTTSTGVLNYVISDISEATVDSSLILAYFNPSTEAATAWYPCPGLGSSGNYMTRYFFYQTLVSPTSEYTMAVRLMNPNGTGLFTGPVTFTKFKIVIAPASVFIGATGPVNVGDYRAVMRFLNTPE